MLKYKLVILIGNNSQYYFFYFCALNQINAALVSIIDLKHTHTHLKNVFNFTIRFHLLTTFNALTNIEQYI